MRVAHMRKFDSALHDRAKAPRVIHEPVVASA